MIGVYNVLRKNGNLLVLYMIIWVRIMSVDFKEMLDNGSCVL